MNKLLSVFLSAYLLICLSAYFSTHAQAEVMTGNDLNLQLDQISPTPTPIPAPQDIKPTANVFIGSNYTVDETDSSPIYISTPDEFVDYGPISVTNPIIRRSQIKALTLGKRFQVIAFENNSPTSSTSASIPDTTCDSGTCNDTVAALWSNTLTFGFGYRCEGNRCDNGFREKDFYKHLSNQTQNESPQQLIDSSGNSSASIIYKLNASASTNTNLPYQNTATYIAVPNL